MDLSNIASQLRAIADELDSPVPAAPVAWAWDATKATLSQGTASLVSRLAATAASGVYLAATVAYAEGKPTDPLVTFKGGNLDAGIPLPAGTKQGCSDDHHLAIRGVMREHDLWHADPVALTCGGGASFPVGSVTEPRPGNSNAARLPLMRGLVTPEDVKAGVINHPLVFCFPVGPATRDNGTSRYPSDTDFNGPSMRYGQWFRLQSGIDVTTLGLGKIGTMVAVALQRYGMFLRDDAASMAIYAVDAINQGGNDKVWPAAGLTLPQTVGGYPYAVRLGAIPWQKMEALDAPSP